MEKAMKKPKLVKTDLDKPIAELADKTNHRALGIWAADCAERSLHYFEEKYPKDNRPGKAIGALRTWAKNGIFSMKDIRGYSLSAHAAAREVKEDDNAARSSARSAGQAVATAHVPTHAIGAAIYSATAIRDATGSMDEANRERDWQCHRLKELNREFGKYKGLWRGKNKAKGRS
jgi:hypothetical protein